MRISPIGLDILLCWSLVGGTVWQGLDSAAMPEEVHHWGWLWEQMPCAPSVYILCFWLVHLRTRALSFPPVMPCLTAMILIPLEQ